MGESQSDRRGAPGPDPRRPGSDVGRPALPRADRVTSSQSLRLAVFRTRSRLLCRVGLHDWDYRRNPEVGGAAAMYHQCRRCGREYSPPDPRQTWF